MEKNYNIDDIENFLNQEMEAEELATFEAEMAKDEVLVEEVHFHEDVIKGIQTAGAKDFRQLVAGVHNDLKKEDFFSEKANKKIPENNRLFSSSIGFVAGFSTMIGNLAGPFANLYFLATKMPKNQLIVTSAWVFFIVNLFKVPFHVFYWGTITWHTLKTNLTLLPFVIIGFLIGIKIVSYFSEKFFRQFLLIATAIGAILILLK